MEPDVWIGAWAIATIKSSVVVASRPHHMEEESRMERTLRWANILLIFSSELLTKMSFSVMFNS